LESLHGWAISQRFETGLGRCLQVSEGSLYPAAAQTGARGMDPRRVEPSESNRRAKFYSLTRSGRKHLEKKPRIGIGSRRPYFRKYFDSGRMSHAPGTLDLHDSVVLGVRYSGGRPSEAELDEELQFHIERQIELQIAQGCHLEARNARWRAVADRANQKDVETCVK